MVGAAEASSPRLIVLSVARTPESSSIVLMTVPVGGGPELIVQLLDSWADSEPSPAPGDVARVILCSSDFVLQPWQATVTREVIVDDAQNLLVLHPDTLVSGTAVADSFVCLRKSVISGRNPRGLGAAGVVSKAALQGSMIHDLFQAILVQAGDAAEKEGKGEDVDCEDGPLGFFTVAATVEDVISAHRMDLYSADMTEAHARTFLNGTLPKVLEWNGAFLGARKEHSIVRDRSQVSKIHVDGVSDIEESVWSPVFGLKGKIDASISVAPGGVGDLSRSVPLELKTGSSKGFSGVSHYAQVVLYMLLMSHRYEVPTKHGLLTYIRPPPESAGSGPRNADADDDGCHGTSLVSMNRGELVGLVVQRNALAYYLAHDARVDDLPRMLEGKPNICERCFALDSCVVQQRLLENSTIIEKDSGHGPSQQLVAERSNHLKSEHERYYRFWRTQMALEESFAVSGRAELWAMSAKEREAQRRAWVGLQLSVPEDGGESALVTSRRIPFTFKRHSGVGDNADVPPATILSKGGYVAISVQSWDAGACSLERGALVPNLASAFVEDISESTVTVSADSNILYWCATRSRAPDSIVWRIDSEEIVASFSTAKATIESLFVAASSGGSQRLRCLVSELQRPKFTPLQDNDAAALAKITEDLSRVGLKLNDEQLQALRKSREARDYMLLLGMPGTGKTATLATIVIAAVRSGQTVLICSHTRTAVDNILSRLLDIGFNNFVRVGALGASGDARIAPFHVGADSDLSVEDLTKRLHTPSVVATTCLGISHAVFARRNTFDMVLVDEASQIGQPICLGPLRFASSSFVLVGDHYQLPPLVRSAHPDRGGAGMCAHGTDDPRESLFRRLCDAHPAAVVSLVRQYRMCADIMRLSNDLVYNGMLVCGSEEVSARALTLDYTGPQKPRPSWLEAVLNPQCRVIFLDTDALKEPQRESSARTNAAEESIIASAVTAMCAAGAAADELALLSPYRAQVVRLQAVLQRTGSGGGDACTIDQYQGKDKDCVIVSLVRRNANGDVGPLLADWRRMNVALTRARGKLILVGSARTIAGGGHFLGGLMDLLRIMDAVHAVEHLIAP